MESARQQLVSSDEVQVALDRALALQGEARLDAIVDSESPQAVVQAMAPAEVFYTFASLEEEGRRSLIKLLAEEQLDHLLDLDIWQGGQLDPDQVLAWLERLWGADQDLAVAWLQRGQRELITTLLRLFCTVTEGPTASQEPLTEGQDRLPPFSAEGLFYIEFHSERAFTLLRGPLLLWASVDIEGYLGQMKNVNAAVPAVIEEAAYQQRWSRLRDEGYVPPEEAYWIYRWPTAAERRHLEEQLLGEEEALPGEVGAAPTARALSAPAGLLALALEGQEAGALRGLSRAIAATSARVLSADHLPLSDLAAHRRALEKTLGYVNIGLHQIARGDLARARSALRRGEAQSLFRLGYAEVAALGRRAVQLKHQGWLSQVGLGLEVLDEPLAEVVLALARPRPLYPAQALDGRGGEREFRLPEEVDRCAELLGRVEALKALFIDALGLDLASAETFDLEGCHPGSVAELTLGLILRTAMAARLLSGHLRFVPVEASRLAELILAVRALSTEGFGAEVIADLEDRLDEPRPPAARGHLSAFVREHLDQLCSALAGIDLSRPVDPRFVGAVIVRDV